MNMQASMFVAMSCEDFKRLVQETIQKELQSLKETNKEPKDETLMSVEELQSFLHVSRVTIHKWKKKKLICSYRIGRKIYFKKTEIIKTLENLNKRRQYD